MRVKIENRDKLFKLNGIYLSHINLDESFEVIGIVNLFKKD